MSEQIHEIIAETLKSCEGLPFLSVEDLPCLDLYMDQVTTLIEEKLSPTRRLPSDKLLTKTMINNYTKNKLLPPPEKKKYSSQQILLLVVIYFSKNILSMQDIKAVLDTVSFDEQVYEEVFKNHDQIRSSVSSDLEKYLKIAEEGFSHTENQEKEQLQLFSLICNLVMDIYMKKRIIEQLIDTVC